MPELKDVSGIRLCTIGPIRALKSFVVKVSKLLTVVLFVISVQIATAQTFYVRAGATGNGTDWNNAFGTLPNSLVRGATYYVADGNYSGYTCDDLESGTFPITIKKATAGAHGSEAGWQASYGDGQAVFGSINIMTDNWVIDGVVGGGPGSWTSGHGFRVNGSIQINPTYNNVHTWQVGIDNGGDNVTLRHIEIVGTLTPGIEDAVSNNNNEGLYLSHLYTRETDNCPLNLFFTSNVVWEYSYVGRFTGSPEFHSEILFLYGKGNASIRHNVFTWVQSTGGLMINNPDRGPVEVYGNVFYRNAGDSWSYGGDGVIGTWINRSDIACHNVSVFNNTFINVPKDSLGIIGSTPSSGLVAKNNYFYNSGTGLPNGKWAHDYNHYQDSGSESESNGSQGGGSSIVSLDLSSTNFAKVSTIPPAGDITIESRFRTDWFGVVGSGRGAVQSAGQVTQDQTPPSVTLQSVSSPISGTISISAQATDTGGSGLSRVEFLLNGQTIGADSTSPYGLSWDSRTVPNGTHSLQANAFDVAGNRGSSAILSVQVQNVSDTTAPTISISAPALNATVSNVVTLAASATDGTGGSGVSIVEFLVSGSLVGSDSTSPYSFSWDTRSVANGSYAVSARARDVAGNTASSPTVTVNVQNSTQTINNGLVLYNNFQEASGTTVFDQSGSANHGQLVNGVSRVQGVGGNGVSFDGTDDYVQIANSASLEPNTTFTVSLWASVQANGSWQSLLNKVASDGSHIFPFSAYEVFAESSGGTFRLRVALSGTDGNRVYADSQSDLEFGRWYHIVGVYDGSSLKMFLNGQQQAVTAVTGEVLKSGSPLYLGRNGVGGDKFKGQLDEVRLFNRALSISEIAYLGTRPGAPTNVEVGGN